MSFPRTFTSQLSHHVRLCAWMHQWHPLIMPEWHAESAEAAADAPAGDGHR